MVDLSLFNEKFGTEEKCRDFLVRNRWPYGFRCPVCGGGHYYYVQTRHIYECQCCRTQTSITSGTLFHGTRLPLQYWFLTMYLLSNDVPCSARWLSLNLQLNYRTASRLLRNVRECMQRCNEYWTNRLIEHVQAGRSTEADRTGSKEGVLHELQLSIEEDEGRMASFACGDQAQLSLSHGKSPAVNEPAWPEAIEARPVTYEQSESGGIAYLAASGGMPNQAEASSMVSPAVGRAWELMGDRISTYIRSRYRRVHRRFLKSYAEEFYFGWTGRFNANERFWQLAQTSTAAFIPASA